MFQNLILRAWTSLHMLSSRVSDDEGQTLAEYGLIMAVIAVAVIAVAAVAFRGAIISAFSKSTTCLGGSC